MKYIKFKKFKLFFKNYIMKKCPYCSEEIQEKAIKCKHCWEWLKKGDKINSSWNENNTKSWKSYNTKIFLVIWFILLVSIYSLLSNNRNDTKNNNKEFNELAEAVTDVVINPDSNISLSKNEIDKIQDKQWSEISNEDVKDILNDTLNKINILKEEYNNNVNAIWDIQVKDTDYNNSYKINEVIKNLKELDRISDEYLFSLINTNKKDKISFDNIYTYDWWKGTSEIQSQFKLQKDFINASLKLYDYLVTIQSDISVVNWQLTVTDDQIINTLNVLIDDMNKKLDLYNNQ